MPCFLLVIFLFKIALGCGAEVLSSFPKSRKAVYALQRKCVLDELCSGLSYSAVGCEFNINESRICIKLVL